jgi:hypothetical protein
MWPTYTGDSVGHWDGRTLVFTTISMIGDKSTVLDRSGLTLSDQAKIVTRMFKTDAGLLRAELTIVDPLALREPWHVTRHFRKLPASPVMSSNSNSFRCTTDPTPDCSLAQDFPVERRSATGSFI